MVLNFFGIVEQNSEHIEPGRLNYLCKLCSVPKVTLSKFANALVILGLLLSFYRTIRLVMLCTWHPTHLLLFFLFYFNSHEVKGLSTAYMTKQNVNKQTKNIRATDRQKALKKA